MYTKPPRLLQWWADRHHMKLVPRDPTPNEVLDQIITEIAATAAAREREHKSKGLVWLMDSDGSVNLCPYRTHPFHGLATKRWRYEGTLLQLLPDGTVGGCDYVERWMFYDGTAALRDELEALAWAAEWRRDGGF